MRKIRVVYADMLTVCPFEKRHYKKLIGIRRKKGLARAFGTGFEKPKTTNN